jgi:hypothetical protein
MTATAQEREAQRGESEPEKLDRNTIELLNEIRVASGGIQFMFGFLLIVPFDNAFSRISSFERTVYFASLLCVAISCVLLMAPSIHHRILFRLHEKRFLIRIANQMAIAGMAFLGAGFTGILVVLSDFVVGGLAPVLVAVAAVLGIGGLWFVLPLVRRGSEPG